MSKINVYWVYKNYCRFIPTNDDWYGTYDGGFVKVTVTSSCYVKGDPGPKYLFITLSGNDDSSLEKRISIESEEVLEYLFQHWVTWVNKLGFVEKQVMLDLGFNYA